MCLGARAKILRSSDGVSNPTCTRRLGKGKLPLLIVFFFFLFLIGTIERSEASPPRQGAAGGISTSSA